jgi:hypothetical protein
MKSLPKRKRRKEHMGRRRRIVIIIKEIAEMRVEESAAPRSVIHRELTSRQEVWYMLNKTEKQNENRTKGKPVHPLKRVCTS